MKNVLKSIMFVAVAAMAFASCSVEPVEVTDNSSGSHKVSFIASQLDTKTTMEISDGIASFSWEKADEEYFHIFENGVPAVETTGVIDENNGTMQIMSEFWESSAPYTYTGFMAATISNENPTVSNEQIDLGAYDPDSDILLAKPVTDKMPEDFSEGILFQFKRVVAINQMTLKGIPAGETVSTVSITSDKPIAGEYDFANGEWNASETSISITTESVANNDGQAVVYFVSAPVEGAQLTVVATTTAEKTYSKQLSKAITFTEGGVKAFGVTVEKDVPTPIEVVFDDLGFKSWGKDSSFSGDKYSSVTQTVGNVQFDYIKNSGSCYANTTAIRFYKSNQLILTAPKGYYITDVKWDGSSFKNDVTTNVKECTSTAQGLSWKGSAYSVAFTRPDNADSYMTLSKVTVTIVKGEIEIVHVTCVELDQNEIALEVGDKATLSAIVNPDNATDNNVTWSSSNEDVATVKDGAVTAISAGTATITVTTVDGGFTDTCDVTVNAAPIKVYGSLAELIADGEPTEDGTLVTVTLTNEVIESIYVTKSGYRNGVFLEVPEQKVEIFCHDVPEDWEALGLLSGTLTECLWKYYNGTWELCPADWSELNYSAPLKPCADPVISISDAGIATITCATDGATIYYTLNDSDPTDASTPYTGAVTMTDGQTIKAIAYKAGMKPSAIASERYFVGGITSSLQLSSAKKFGTTSGSTLNDDQQNVWTCTGDNIQNSYQTTYSGQQFGTGKTNNVFTFTSPFSGKTISSITIKAAAGGTIATYSIKVGDTLYMSGNLSKTSTEYNCTVNASGSITVTLDQNKGEKAVYLDSITVVYN